MELFSHSCNFFETIIYLTFVLFCQLYSLNDYKPPISKAKMTQITKAAIKAIKVSCKFYSCVFTKKLIKNVFNRYLLFSVNSS